MSLRVFVFSCAASVALAQTGNDPEQLAQRLSAMHDAWGPRTSSPNVSLTIVKESQAGADFRCGLRATGVPTDAVFTLVSWAVTQHEPANVLQGVTFDDEGVAICAGRAGTCGSPALPRDPIHLPFHAVAGEPVRLAIISSDGSMKAFAKIVPLPLEGEDQGCRVSATLLTAGAELLFVEGTGFPPNTELMMSTDSAGEKHDVKGTADAQGRFRSALLPYKQGLGHGTVKIVLKGGACSPTVTVPWGRRK